MKLKILIVEDEVLLADEIENSLREIGYDIVGNVTTGEEAIMIAETAEPDLILMDIKLRGNLTGIESAAAILIKRYIPIIYLTDITKKSTWEKAKYTNPAAYIVKPFNSMEVDIAFQIAFRNASGLLGYNLDPIQNLTPDANSCVLEDRIYLRDNTRYIRVSLENIIYVKGAGSYVEVYTVDRKIVLTYNLSQFQKRLSSEYIIRLHKSYLVNISKITSIEGNRVFLELVEIPIGKSYKEEFMTKVRLI